MVPTHNQLIDELIGSPKGYGPYGVGVRIRASRSISHDEIMIKKYKCTLDCPSIIGFFSETIFFKCRVYNLQHLVRTRLLLIEACLWHREFSFYLEANGWSTTFRH